MDFRPGSRLTEERWEGIGVMKDEFLWEEERKLAATVLLAKEKAITWEGEKGMFRDDYAAPEVRVVRYPPYLSW